MTPLVDSDVILDVALGRVPFLRASSEFLDHLSRHPYRGMVSWHSIANIFYILRPIHENRPTRALIADLLTFLKVVSGQNDHLLAATRSPMPDFEDAMQVAAAEANGATCIVTRNQKDYLDSPIAISSPEDALPLLGN